MSATGRHRFKVEVAETPEQMTQGLMFRRSLAPDVPDDLAAVDAIQAQLHAEGDRMSSLVALIAQSPLMTMRTGEL